MWLHDKEIADMLKDYEKNMKAVDEMFNKQTKTQAAAFPAGDAKSYDSAEKIDIKTAADGTPVTFTDAGTLGKNLTAVRKANSAKDMTKPENWTQEMILFYNYLVEKCNERAQKGYNYFLCNGTNTPKTFNFVLDYLRDHNNVMYMRETCKGFSNIEDGVYFRLVWG